MNSCDIQAQGMKNSRLGNVFAFVFGGLFSIGLLVSGLANPQKVIGFLDFFGDWDPSLAFVMLGAIMLCMLPFQRAIRNPQTLFNEKIELPQNNQIDSKLILGAVLFGVGWGLTGICPAPSISLIGLGYWEVLYFVGAMCCGIWIHRKTLGAG